MGYSLQQLKMFAAKGRKPKDLDVHESVIYHTYCYCYKAYAEHPTESTKRRLEEFVAPVVKVHYRREEK